VYTAVICSCVDKFQHLTPPSVPTYIAVFTHQYMVFHGLCFAEGGRGA